LAELSGVNHLAKIFIFLGDIFNIARKSFHIFIFYYLFNLIPDLYLTLPSSAIIVQYKTIYSLSKSASFI
ncbi:MAG TPA: hypothetical protein PKK37_04205, partial [Candidatus Pacearchaeota archaeon]|nr:hypothetical protein [Candidatus Pacearchaeota archaeon]